MEWRRASCKTCIQAWTFGIVWDAAGVAWEGVTVAWEDAVEGTRGATADTGVWGTWGPDSSPGWSGSGADLAGGTRERGRGIGLKNGRRCFALPVLVSAEEDEGGLATEPGKVVAKAPALGGWGVGDWGGGGQNRRHQGRVEGRDDRAPTGSWPGIPGRSLAAIREDFPRTSCWSWCPGGLPWALEGRKGPGKGGRQRDEVRLHGHSGSLRNRRSWDRSQTSRASKIIPVRFCRRRGDTLNPSQGSSARQDRRRSCGNTGQRTVHGTWRTGRDRWLQGCNSVLDKSWHRGYVLREGKGFARLLINVLRGHLYLLLHRELFHAGRQRKRSGKHGTEV